MFSEPDHTDAAMTRKSQSYGRLLLLLAALFGVACGDTDAPSDTTDTSVDTLPGGRTYLLAARAEAYDPTRGRPFIPSLDALTIPPPAPPDAADPVAPPPDRPLEAIVVPVDLLGIPWTSFSGPDNRPTDLPAAWLAQVENLETLVAELGLPVVLAISPLSSEHDTLAPLASDQSGALVLNPTWKPSCYDASADSNPTLHRDQFAGFVVWLAERFQPTAIVLAQRVNLYEANCSASAFTSVVGFANHAHARLATATLTIRPRTIVSFDVEDLYGFPARPGRCVSTSAKDCLATRQSLMSALTVDHLGLESNPWRAFGDLSDIPRDWLSSVAAAQPLPALVASTGIPSLRMDAVRGACAPFIESDELAQRAWLDQAIAFSAAEQAPLLVWRRLWDQLPTPILQACPCTGDVALCTHLDGLGNRRDERRASLASGLAASDGNARQALTLWRSLLVTP